MIIDGKKIAEELIGEMRKEVLMRGERLSLGILLMEPDFATEKFVAIKRRTAEKIGITLAERRISPKAETEEVLRELEKLSGEADGIIVQLPLSVHVDAGRVLSAIPSGKDVDGVGKNPLIFSPVVEAMREILIREHITVKGRRALVVGQGRLVGGPAIRWLKNEGADVAVLPGPEAFDASVVQDADIIVLGAGSPGLLKPEMVKKGVVILDAGTSEAGGKLAGDADPACAEKAALFTPVPGGIGPVAVAMIFKNLFALTEKKKETV